MATPTSGGNTGAQRGVFEQALDEFKSELKPKDSQLFRRTTIKDLLDEIDTLQRDQNASRRLQAIGRLKPTLEAITQLGKVIEVFANSSEYVAFIWGPMKFLLQTASQFVDAFNELLDVYKNLSQHLPVISQYEKHFRHDHQMERVLGYLYKDILEFHRRALKFFHQPMWRQLFQATWKTHKSRFDNVIQDIHRHCSLVESQALISQMQGTEAERIIGASKLQSMMDTQKLHTRMLEAQERSEDKVKERQLYSWFKAANVKNDQDYFSRTRNAYPGSGRWLLENATFKAWSEPVCQVVPPLLWLNGLPGAGKTILASLIVEELQRMPAQPAVLYFYCKQGDGERNNFSSICRSLLSQLLEYSKDMLLQFYFKAFSESSEPVLTTQSEMKDLLTTAVRNCQSAYIILDGIDECSREERILISSWFRDIVEALPTSNMDQIRCLFVSQDDGFARKDFASLTSLKIRVEDSNKDIRHFSSKWALDIQKKFGLTTEKRNIVESKIQEAAGGMFLLAKLIATNLLGQIELDGLEYEMEANQLPRELNAAYARIMARIVDQATPAEQEGSSLLLSWLVCAKRSLKWHEIQAAKSIHPDTHTVDFDQWEFKVDSKDLCGSLVEIRPDMTVELIHTTARRFLILERHVSVPRTDFDLAQLCVNYLNFGGLTKHAPDNIQDLILDGYYVFMEYAVAYWVRHVEDALSITEDLGETKIKVLAESLETFMEHHSFKLNKVLPLSKGTARRLEILQPYMQPIWFSEFQQAVVSMRKQLTFCGEMRSADVALDFSNVVKRVREALETLLLPPTSSDMTAKVMETYGSDLFRCDRLSCKFFASGFDSKEQRDKHLEKHSRPFICTVTGCPSASIGYSSKRDLEKHTTTAHPGEVSHHDSDDYPDEVAINAPSTRENSSESESSQGSSDEDEETEAPQPQSPPKRQVTRSQPGSRKREKKTYTCQNCQKTFTRKFNYNSHLLTHGIYTGMWKCTYCDKKFPRKSDWTRHELGHGKSERYTCRACGKAFARRDTLANHQRSKKGKKCLAALQHSPSEVPGNGSRYPESCERLT